MKKLLLIMAILLFPMIGVAQETLPAGIYIIFDGSGSMWQKLAGGAFKIDVAKQVLQDFVGGDFEGYELAMRAYGHRRKGDCRDSELVIPFTRPDAVFVHMQEFMGDVNPTGKTPISYSFRQALKDFGDRSGEIILISDGIETCDEDPCALMKEWRESNVKIRVHVVGLGLDEKSKEAMRCISDAAGTEYYDANSASELADGLKKIHEQSAWAGFAIEGTDERGESIRVDGTLSRDGKDLLQVSDNRWHKVEAGQYELKAGARTKNGNLYNPITKTVTVAKTGETKVQVSVPTPPSVKAKFLDRGEEKRGSQITAYQNGVEAFQFRWKDEVYLDEGTYEFRAKPNPQNDLSVTETFAAGDHKEIVFEMVHTVRARFKLVAAGSGIWFRENYELWQNGEKKYNVHASNGALVLPGTYDLVLPNVLTPYTKEGVVVTAEDEQSFEFDVPVGHVTFIYQKADGTRDKDDRCFVGRGGSRSTTYKNSGERYPLTPGAYYVNGWRYKGEYESVEFEIQQGKDTEVVLQAKK